MVFFEVTPECNLDCIFCYNVWKKHKSYPYGILPFTKVNVLLERIKDEFNSPVIQLTGGEPFLRKDIFDIISAIEKYRMEYEVSTNASMLNKKKVARAFTAKAPRRFNLTILSNNPKIHNEITKGHNFEKIIETVKIVKQYDVQIIGTILLMKKNASTLKETIELLVELEMDEIFMNRVLINGEATRHLDDVLLSREKIEEAFVIADNIAQTYGIPISSNNPFPLCLADVKQLKHFELGRGGCMLGFGFVVDFLGNVRPCNGSITILGNLFHQSLLEMLTKNMKKLKNLMKHPKICGRCNKKNVCVAGCRASGESWHGCAGSPDPLFTFFQKKKE